jgi:hypothetical protein
VLLPLRVPGSTRLLMDGREIASEVELVVPPWKTGYLLPDFFVLHSLPLVWSLITH